MNRGHFYGRPIESLQHMLRVLSTSNPSLIPVAADGMFDRNTENAVSAFQRSMKLPATGTVDPETWNALVREWERRDWEEQMIEVLCLNPVELERDYGAAQEMLDCCGRAWGSIPKVQVTGQRDAPTIAALKRVQKMCGLPETGTMDGNTMRHLRGLYSIRQKIKK